MKIKTNINENDLTFLLDTQADVSILKIDALQKYLHIDTENSIQLKGITDEYISSHGSQIVDLHFDHIKIKYKFQIVDEKFPIPAHGIIGKDFIQDFKCILDFSDMNFTIQTYKQNIILPINYGPNDDRIAIPPRCEVFRVFKIDNFTGTAFIEQREIHPGIFIANTIIHESNPVIRIINTNESMEIISNKISEISNIEHFNIFSMNKTIHSDDRVNELRKIFSKNTPKEKLNTLTTLCENFTDIFTLKTDKLTVNNFYTQKIRITDDAPVYTKNYRLPHGQKAEVDKQINKLMEDKLIEPSISPYNSPIILVPKKSINGEKKWRLCIDYRRVNKKLIPDKFPLPRMDVILEGLGNAKYFSTLDLFSGFHQIPVEQNSREITAFTTEKGIFQWTVLPFGLNIAPNSFCRMMAIAFAGLKPEQCFLYVDDIIVLGKNERHHIENLKIVFERCRKYNLKLNPEKCQFFRNEIIYLGHKCTDHGIMPDETKLEAVRKYPRPKDKAAVKSFTAFMNYYRKFIQNYAEIARPLNKMTGKNATYEWTEECEKAFNTLKEKLLTQPILQYPNFEKEFTITVDASTFACGGILSQNTDNTELPIAYISRSFVKGEKNKPIIEKELLAIHFAIMTFEPYIWGKHFTIRTDHKPLVHLYNLKNPTSKLSQIRMDLEKFNFTIVYIPGKLNVTADALSRITIDNLTKIYQNNVTLLMTVSKPLAIHMDVIKQVFEENNQILAVQTRSMTRKLNEQKELKDVRKNERKIIEYMPVIEEFNECHLKMVPKVITNDDYKLKVHKKSKMLINVDLNKYIIDRKFALEKLLTDLEKQTNEMRIKQIKWPMNDNFFKLISLNTFKNACNKILRTLSISLTKPTMEVGEKSTINEIIKRNHDNPFYGGHFGQKKLLEKIKTRYKWKNMAKDVAQYTKNCEKCKLNKIQSHTREPMKITETPQSPFDIVIIDTIGPLPKTEAGHEYAVTIICDLSKYLIMVPITDKTANSVAKAIFENVILIFGPIINIRTDRGTEYNNNIMKQLFLLLDIKHNMSTAYHHETVGSIERNHRTLNEYIRIYVTNMNQWDEYVQYFTYCYNTAKHSAFNNKYSPYELIFGKNPREFNEILNGHIDPIYNFDSYVSELKFKLQTAHNQAKTFVEKNKQISKKYYDRKTNRLEIQIGDQIKIEKEPRNKHKQLYEGPYTVTGIDEQNIQYTDKNNKTQIIHKNRTAVY